MCASARSISESNLIAAFGLCFRYQSTTASYSAAAPRESPPNQWALGSFAKLRLRTSDHEVVLALPESRSANRFPISASQAC